MQQKQYPYHIWLLLTALVTLFGFQSLRVSWASATWGFVRGYSLVFHLSPIGILFITIAILLTPLFVLSRVRWGRLSQWLLWGCAGQSVLRVAEQISQSPILDYFLAVGGVAAFIFYFAIIYQIARIGAVLRGRDIALGILVGTMLDTALRGILWTLDLSWQPGWMPLCFVLVLAGVMVFLSSKLRCCGGDTITIPASSISMGAIIFGPYIFLIQHVFCDFSRLSIQTGWSYPVVVLAALAGNSIGILGALFVMTQYPKRRQMWTQGILFLFVVASAGTSVSGSAWLYVTSVFTTEFAGSILLTLMLELLFVSPGCTFTQKMRWIYVFGFILYSVIFGMFYVLGTVTVTFPIIAVFISLVSLKVFAAASTTVVESYPLRKITWLSFFGVGSLVMIGCSVLIKTHQSSPAPVPIQGHTLRIMTFNLHQGFNHIGQMSIREQANFIRDSGADVIALNEVSRGWILNGGLDMLLWLSRDLENYAVFGPTIGQLNGNAFLSKQPLIFERSILYTQRSTLFSGGCLKVSTSVNGQPLYLAVTHLNWSDKNQSVIEHAFGPSWSGGEDSVREAQSQEFVSRCGGDGPTILMGDMNALPDSDTIQHIQDAGYADVSSIDRCVNAPTWWALNPEYHLDYIFGSPEVFFETCDVPQVLVSDHLPIITSIALPVSANLEKTQGSLEISGADRR